MIKKTLFLIISFLVFVSAQSQELPIVSQHLSVKGRWSIKLGYSTYKTFSLQGTWLPSTKDDERILIYKLKSNIRLELNYGVLKWLEVGGYIGLMNYEYLTEEIWESAGGIGWPNYPDAFAPTFGVNVNIQLLPLMVKNPKCHWDLYIPFRYGGCYLIKYGGKYVVEQSTSPLWDNKVWDGKDKQNGYEWVDINYNKYRHEYSVGLGVAVYIKNIMGFYIEAMGGQLSYWPELVKSPYSIRFGLAAKF